MPDEQLPTQHADAVPPGWQVLPIEPLPRPTYFPAGLAMGVAFLFWGLITTNGGNNMPAFGSSLKPQELDALVAFLESRKRPLRPQDRSPMKQN